jgi:hypothetical protein
MRTIKSKDIETQRRLWVKVAKENDWYVNPFYIQIWVDKEGCITDSVSVRGLKRDYIISTESCKILKKNQYKII